MKYNRKIISYLDNQMNDKEKAAFEEELNSSIPLQKELNDYKKFLLEIEEVKKIETASNYFDNVIPNFRLKIARKNKAVFLPKFSYGLAALIIIFISVFYFYNNSVEPTFITEVQPEINSAYDPLIEELTIADLTSEIEKNYDSLMNVIMYNELELNFLDINNIIADSDLDYLGSMDNLNEEEAEIIYYEVLNKKFF